MRFVAPTCLAVIACCCFVTTANSALITFEPEPEGYKLNGFHAREDINIRFNDTAGNELYVRDWEYQSFGHGLGVLDDLNAGPYPELRSKLRMDFTKMVSALSLWFGNDDWVGSSPGDLAVLQAFRGDTLVAQQTIVLNRDDGINQSIGLSGFAFDGAVFYYAKPDLSPMWMAEIVDNIEFTVVPEPATYFAGGLLLLPFAVQGINRLFRQKN